MNRFMNSLQEPVRKSRLDRGVLSWLATKGCDWS